MRIGINYLELSESCDTIAYPTICVEGRVLTRWPEDRRKCAAAVSALRCFDNTSGGVRIRTLPVGSWLATRAYVALNGSRLAGIRITFASAGRVRMLCRILRL